MILISYQLVLFLTLTRIYKVITVKCVIGWGQDGLLYSNGVSWTRNCVETDYCFKAVTSHIDKVQKLIEFPWDRYYYKYYVLSCGGALGTQAKNFHPWRGNDPNHPHAVEGKLNYFLNLTFPMDITGHGGTDVFQLAMTCRQDYCTTSSGYLNKPLSIGLIILIITLLLYTFHI